jgi:hypothetical protein
MRAVVLLAAALPLLADEAPLKRAGLTPVEQAMDKRILGTAGDDPFDLLGGTRGLYLEGFGAVFTAELSLVVTPTVSPFRQKITPEEAKRFHDRKLKRLPLLKQLMRELLVSAATSLDALPPGEQVVFAIRLLYLPWENTAGLPSEIVVRADRTTLLKRAGLDSAIRMEEH